jgi:DNA adenine methylase
MRSRGKVEAYEDVKESFNARPNGADLVFLCRACYGGIVRFRKADGHMSTPCGAQRPIPPAAFAARVDQWHRRVRHATFVHADFAQALDDAREGDLIYCDPPYSDTQSILYGAQAFSLTRLFDAIARCKDRGVFVALSIDGSKRSGDRVCDIAIPAGLFASEVAVNCGRSMLRRFQMAGQTLESEVVADRLLLTYSLDD